MDWSALLIFCYSKLWSVLWILATGFILLCILGILVAFLMSIKQLFLAGLLTAISSIVSIVFNVIGFVWILMLTVNIGHWIGVY